MRAVVGHYTNLQDLVDAKVRALIENIPMIEYIEDAKFKLQEAQA
jgi:hypothetical protein